MIDPRYDPARQLPFTSDDWAALPTSGEDPARRQEPVRRAGRPLLWVRLICGGCGNGFTADPDKVPMLAPEGQKRRPTCKACWDLRNRVRAAANLPQDDRPNSYPEDWA